MARRELRELRDRSIGSRAMLFEIAERFVIAPGERPPVPTFVDRRVNHAAGPGRRGPARAERGSAEGGVSGCPGSPPTMNVMSLITPERPSREYEVAAYHDPAPIKEHRPLRDLGRRLWAMLVGAGAFLLKFGAILYKLKFVTVAGSMIISIGAYALLGGWWFGVGLVALDLRPRDGTRSCAAPAGRSCIGSVVHPLHGRRDRDEEDA